MNGRDEAPFAETISFGPYTLKPTERVLCRGDEFLTPRSGRASRSWFKAARASVWDQNCIAMEWATIW